MAQQTINVGAAPNDGTGTPLRTAFQYTNNNFSELYTALGGGVGLPGATTQVIFNDGGTNLAGDAGLVYNKTTDALTVGGNVQAASATITGDLTVDTSTLKVDSTNNSVGIGTASPAYVADVSVATTDGLRVKNTLATSAYFNRFHISNDTGINFIGYGPSYGGGTILGLGVGSNSIFSDAAAPFGIATTVNQPLVFGINGSTAMTLNSTVLAIGVTPAPWATIKAIQVGDGASLFGFTATEATLSGNTYYNGGFKYVGNGQASQYQQQIGEHRWFSAVNNTSGAGAAISFGNAKMTLDTSGNLLVGTTSVTTTAPLAKLHISLNGTDRWAVGPQVSSTDFIIQAVTGFGVYLAGTTATSWSSASDERLKDVIEPISNAISKVGSLRAVIGKFKSDKTNTRKPFLMAQDVLAVLPEAVDVSKPDQFGLAYTDVIPLLVAAIKELTARVQTLEAK